MYVCLCNNVTDRQIREAVRGGCRRLEDLSARLGVATNCGSCAEGYIGCCKAIRDMNLCGMLSRIAVPTMIIVGEDDPACPVSSAETLHEGIAGSELIVIAAAAHLPNIEKPVAFNDALLGFLDRQ